MNWGRQLINNILTNEKYVIMEFSEAEKLELASDEEIARISERLISKNLEAYNELANDKTYRTVDFSCPLKGD